MKVKDLIKHLNCCTNAVVILENRANGDLVKLPVKRIHHDTPEYILNLKLQSFNVIDNVITINVYEK